MQDCNLHTVLRLPRGTFTPYSQGVKANVIFLQKGKPTEAVWIFDARSNVPGITKKDRPLSPNTSPNSKPPTAKTRMASANVTRLGGRPIPQIPPQRNQRTRLQTRHHLAQRRFTGKTATISPSRRISQRSRLRSWRLSWMICAKLSRWSKKRKPSKNDFARSYYPEGMCPLAPGCEERLPWVGRP